MPIRPRPLILLILISLVIAPLRAQVPVDDVSTMSLATAEQGRAILGRTDAYIETMTPWERGARMGRVAEVPIPEFLDFVRGNVTDWTPRERTGMLATLRALAPRLEPYARWMPPEVLIVRTTGREDYGDAYTRSNAIVIKGRSLGFGVSPSLVAHEMWHVISRAHPRLRDRVYAVIGFEPCGPLQWPPQLDRPRLTNPDAPINQHWIKITYDGHDYHAMPIMTARSERFGLDSGSSLGFLHVRLLMVEKSPDGQGVVPVLKDGEPLEAEFDQVSGLYEQLGHNTNYLLHPEEWIADNFAELVMGTPVASPEILAKLKAALMEPAANRE